MKKQAGREDHFFCEKTNRWLGVERESLCPSPDSYCRFRTACIIWALRDVYEAAQSAPVGLDLTERTERGSMEAFANGNNPVHAVRDGLGGAGVEPEMPLVLFFWAPMCGACEAVALMLDVLALKWGHRVKVLEVNVDDEPALAAAFQVRGVPALVGVRGAEMVDARIGAGDPEALEGLFARLAGPLPG